MANLKEIRTRIASVSSTRQITSAMKMVSAAKLRKAQTTIQHLRPYSKKMTEIISRLLTSDGISTPYTRIEKEPKRVLLVCLTSNKGLCSTFNSSIVKLTQQRVKELQSQGVAVSIKSFGKRGDAVLSKLEGVDYLGSQDDIWDNPDFASVQKISQDLMQAFASKTYDRVEVVYNVFKNAAYQVPSVEQFLPIQLEVKQGETNSITDYIFQPDRDSILNSAIPLALNTQLYKCFADSFASEHGARMSSMNKATDNATELLKDLTLTYNKLRQASITNEIIEICSGADALN